MSKTKAFKAVVYNPETIGDFKHVVCPPYDVISSQSQDMLHERSLHNFIHILLAKDSPLSDKYRRAGEMDRRK